MDLGVTTIGVVSNNEVCLYELAPGTAVDEKELRRLNRAIERSKRINNPNNYNADGTIKKGRHKWNFSHNCQRLMNERKELLYDHLMQLLDRSVEMDDKEIYSQIDSLLVSESHENYISLSDRRELRNYLFNRVSRLDLL